MDHDWELRNTYVAASLLLEMDCDRRFLVAKRLEAARTSWKTPSEWFVVVLNDET